MKIHRLHISKYNRTPAQRPKSNMTKFHVNRSDCSSFDLSTSHTLLMPKLTVHVYQKVVIGVEKQQLLRPYEIPHEPRSRWQEEPRASGFTCSIQTALNLQGGPTTFQVGEETCGEQQTEAFSRSSGQVMATSLSRDTAGLL